jgi:hypothetical protein
MQGPEEVATRASHLVPQNTLRHHFRLSSHCARIRGAFLLFLPWMHMPVSPRRHSPRQSPQQWRQWRTAVMSGSFRMRWCPPPPLVPFPETRHCRTTNCAERNLPAGEFPFRGWVIWLTPEQGGRKTGPPGPRRHGLTTRQRHMSRRAPLTPAWAHSSCGPSMPARGDPAPGDAGWSPTPRAISWSSRVL